MAYSTIPKSSSYFNTKIYTGNGSAGHSITGVGFQPDWVWIKTRSDSNNHTIFDAVRGVTKRLRSNQNNAENTSSGVTSFDSDGFTVGTDSAGNSGTMVSWNWKAGGGQGSANTDGSINTTYTSANTTSGFSISKFVGTGSNATVGHGLGVVPSMYMVKKLDSSGSWGVYHKSLGATKSLFLDLNDTGGTHIDYWNNTEPTSSVFSVGTSSTMNYNNQNMIAYCFAEKKGFSKFGSYTGNGNADGSFVYTGFKPAFVMIKRTNATGDWGIFDNKREGYNDETNRLKPNSSDAEEDDNFMDILSNGFKLRLTSSSINASGGTFIFMAFAEEPFVSSNGVAATAR